MAHNAYYLEVDGQRNDSVECVVTYTMSKEELIVKTRELIERKEKREFKQKFWREVNRAKEKYLKRGLK